MLWYGSEESIPSGWHVCDGTMGTPNLQGRFVLAAHPNYPAGTIGGTSTHRHTFVGDGHAHDLASGNDVISDSPNGNRYHGTSVSPATGDTSFKAHWPSFHALCYIMKL